MGKLQGVNFQDDNDDGDDGGDGGGGNDDDDYVNMCMLYAVGPM